MPALQIEMILITNNLPSGYHRDFQLLKENMISALEEMKTVLEIFNYSIQQIQVKKINLQDYHLLWFVFPNNSNSLSL